MQYADSKRRLIESLRREIRDQRVLDAIASVRREDFVPADLAARAYDDAALPIGEGQTISQPLMVAIMLQAMDVQPSNTVLDVGTGSGYQAALLSRLAARVIGVERIPAMVARARRVLQEGGYDNVEVFEALPVLGSPGRTTFDGIVVAAAAPAVPQSLVDQLKVGGHLVIPVGTPFEQNLAKVIRTDHGREVQWLGPCRFVPLIGEEAWTEDATGLWPDEPTV